MAFISHPVAVTSANNPNSGQNGRPGHVGQNSVVRTKPRHEDEEQGKLFVGGLSWDTTQDTLLRYFSRFGEVIDCVVMKNVETGRSRGFGFVTYSDPDNIDKVLASVPHSLDGRTIDPKACNPRSMQKPKRTTYLPKVFLGGLPASITETDLRSFFSRYGEVCEVVIMYAQEKKKSRGFGFLSFGDDEACSRAVEEHYVNIHNKQVEVKRAEPRTNQMSTNGDVKYETLNGQEWAILPPTGVTNGQQQIPSSIANTPRVIPQQVYPTWTTTTPTIVPQQAYTNQHGLMTTAPPVTAQPTQWGQPPPIMAAAQIPQQPAPVNWAQATVVPTVPPPIIPTVAYHSPPPVHSQMPQQTQQYPGGPALYVPPSTPQPHSIWPLTPSATPTPTAANGLPTLVHDPYLPMQPLPASSPHQANKLAGYSYGQPIQNALTPTMAYSTYQSPPPAAVSQQLLLSKVQLHPGQFIYSSPADYISQQMIQAHAGLTTYTQSADLAGTLGRQRSSMFTQPSQAQRDHPYRRT